MYICIYMNAHKLYVYIYIYHISILDVVYSNITYRYYIYILVDRCMAVDREFACILLMCI